MTTTRCPHCDADLRGEPIDPRHFVHNTPDSPTYNPGEDTCDVQAAQFGRCYCLPHGEREPDDRFYSRTIGIEVRGVYDGVLYWQCPDCGFAWQRFDPGTRLANKAVAFIDQQNSTLR